MGRTDFSQRTSRDKLNSPRSTCCALPLIGKIATSTITMIANKIMELPRTRFTPRLLVFFLCGDGVVCYRVHSILPSGPRAEHHSSQRARPKKELTGLLSQGPAGKSNRQNLSAI